MSGCLVDDPPPYPEPKQTPPRLSSPTPSTKRIITTKAGDILNFQVFSASEDAGDGLNAFLLLDYSGEALPDQVSSDTMPPSTLDDTSRFFDIPWLVRRGIPGGCHRLTLRVSHAKNMPDSRTQLADPGDLAEVFWWLQHDADPGTANSLVNCPVEGM